MAKTKRYNNFREFYEDEERPRKKTMPESKKEKDRVRNQYKYIDPKDLNEDEFDDYKEDQ
jgi:hypothetical protein